MSFQFVGKRAIVTGASSGIGRGIAVRFGELGVKVILSGRNEGELQKTKNTIDEKGGWSATVPGDILIEKDLENLVAKSLEMLGGIDILVNCAGISLPALFEDLDMATVKGYIDVNYLAPVALCKKVIPLMKEQKSGYIVNVSSMAGLKGLPHFVPYSASKFALLGFSDGLRHEVKQAGIRISVMCPPGVYTPMVTDTWENQPAWFKKFRIIQVDAVVNSLIKGMKCRKFLILVSFDTKLMHLLLRFFPRTFTSLMTWLFKIEL